MFYERVEGFLEPVRAERCNLERTLQSSYADTQLPEGAHHVIRVVPYVVLEVSRILLRAVQVLRQLGKFLLH